MSSSCEEGRMRRSPHRSRTAAASDPRKPQAASAAGESPGSAPRSVSGGQRSESSSPRETSTRTKTAPLVSLATSTARIWLPDTTSSAEAALGSEPTGRWWRRGAAGLPGEGRFTVGRSRCDRPHRARERVRSISACSDMHSRERVRTVVGA
eukprot:scaffold10615_cov106-Isochrysis_galbana.AAC.2